MQVKLTGADGLGQRIDDRRQRNNSPTSMAFLSLANSMGFSEAGLLEKLHDILSARIRDLQRLNSELLLRLQCVEPCRRFLHIRIDETADTG
jgi:hypothetical protein